MIAEYKKKPPCGNANFKSIRTEGYAYVDKTPYIELLEQEPNKNLFFTRSRKFGKSLFFSMLSHYYDVCGAEKFPELFGDLYIGRRPTEARNSYLVIWFDFSGIDTTSQEGFALTFTANIRQSVLEFINAHRSLLPDFKAMKAYARTQTAVNELLGIAFDTAEELGRQAFVIIDEYDHFANDFIAMGTSEGIEFYKKNIRANGMVRDFYETIKAKSRTVIARVMLTGVTPVMLDDLTSGFNVTHNITLDPLYNEMFGFTQEEVDCLMDETGIDRSRITIDMKQLYNGYLFHPDGKHTVYNPSMINYLIAELPKCNYRLENVIDENLKMDYSRLRMLLSTGENRRQLMEITRENGIAAELVPKFPLDKMHDSQYFVSLLFYLGLLTFDESNPTRLKIPNHSIRGVFWEYIGEQTIERNKLVINYTRQTEALISLAYKGKAKPFFDCVSEEIFSRLSDRDLIQFDEKYIKIMLLSRLFQSSFFLPVSETELSTGYADIWLERSGRHPNTPYEWVWDLKYVKASDAGSEKAVSTAFEQAKTQLQRYRSSHRLAGRTDMRYLAVVFIGKDKYAMEELT